MPTKHRRTPRHTGVFGRDYTARIILSRLVLPNLRLDCNKEIHFGDPDPALSLPIQRQLVDILIDYIHTQGRRTRKNFKAPLTCCTVPPSVNLEMHSLTHSPTPSPVESGRQPNFFRDPV